MQRSIDGMFHPQATPQQPQPATQPPVQLPQPAAVAAIQQHVVTVASTQSDTTATHHSPTAAQLTDGGTSNPVGKVEAYLTKIARLAQNLPGGGPIQVLAESALTDLLLDSRTESQLLRDLETEQTPDQTGGGTGGPPQESDSTSARPPKKPRTTHHDNPTAAALQRLISKAQTRMASAREHIYIYIYIYIYQLLRHPTRH